MVDIGVPPAITGCWPTTPQARVPGCEFGDRGATHTMVLYGDSQAGMWFRALDDIAIRAHWKLVVLSKAGCPAAALSVQAIGGGGAFVACDKWHQFAINRINRIAPDLLVVSQASQYRNPTGATYTAAEWQRGWGQLFSRLTTHKTVKMVIGSVPLSGGPNCLARHMENVQACSVVATSTAFTDYNLAEEHAATAGGARYINTTPWFCARTCSAVVGDYDVYSLADHVAVGYSRFLEGVLAQALDLSSYGKPRPQ